MKRILFSEDAVREALRASPSQVVAVYINSTLGKERREWQKAAKAAGVPIDFKPPEELFAIARQREIDVLAITGDYPYASVEELEVCMHESDALVVAIDEVTDPHNLGAIIRSAVAFGASAIVLPKHRTCPVTPTVTRVSTGATELIKIIRITNLAQALRTLRDQGASILGLHAEGEQQLDAAPQRESAKQVLVIGAEGRGLRELTRKTCDALVRIPMHPPLDSLNASVAAAVALYELRRPYGEPATSYMLDE